MTKKVSWLALMGLALGALPCFAQSQNLDTAPTPPAEDPAYLESSRSEEGYTVEEEAVNERAPASELSQPSTVPPSAPDANLNTQNTTPPSVPQSQPQQNRNSTSGGPVYIENMRKTPPAPGSQQPVLRAPSSSAQPSQPAQPSNAGRTETTGAPSSPTGTQLAFFEITPTLGAISIEDKNVFSVGTNLSFRLAQNTPFYFEPSVYVSFLGGDNDQNTTLFHLDGGLRYDFVISQSPLVPFLKAAVGPTLASNNNTVVNGETIGDSYINMFGGGGVKVLVNPRIAARVDAGVTIQSTDPGLYAMGAIALPL